MGEKAKHNNERDNLGRCLILGPNLKCSPFHTPAEYEMHEYYGGTKIESIKKTSRVRGAP